MSTLLWLVCALQDPAVDLKVGDPAPKFELLDDAGKPWKSEDHVGKKIVVLYFYPASFTGGCTMQARAFRDSMTKFHAQDVEIVGISGDAVKTQEAFKSVHQLNFALLADEKGALAALFGVPVKPGATTPGKVGDEVRQFTRGVTISRWTFVIDRNGRIAYKNPKVNPGRDSADVLEVVGKLRSD
jgi:peroxiredoxin Q/BCP